jgi:hypothetical protein
VGIGGAALGETDDAGDASVLAVATGVEPLGWPDGEPPDEHEARSSPAAARLKERGYRCMLAILTIGTAAPLRSTT